MVDYLFILIALMLALGINLIVWAIIDMKQSAAEEEEIERWLTAPSRPCDRGIRASCPSHQGEQHDKK